MVGQLSWRVWRSICVSQRGHVDSPVDSRWRLGSACEAFGLAAGGDRKGFSPSPTPWDQGSEMAKVADFELASGFKVHFCDPHSPWQRPTNENVNGLVREFFPKGASFAEISDEGVANAQHLLNNRPRKVLGWKLPSEVMQEVLAEGAMVA